MDISTLFAAPPTAASAAALSLGALGGTGIPAAAGEGVEGLDSFNQLLGNFLALTGGEVPAGAPPLEAIAPVQGDGGSFPIPTAGFAGITGSGLLKGLNLSGQASNSAAMGKMTEGRWAQSGLTLLAGGALAGQELNQEVVAFLNDLSTALHGDGLPAEIAADEDDSVAEVTVEGDAVETLVLLQGETAASIQPEAALPTVAAMAAAPVIPLAKDQKASGPLGLTLTTAGTGLKALQTVPAPADITAPATASVIPRLGSNSIQATTTTSTPVMSAAPAVAVELAPDNAQPSPIPIEAAAATEIADNPVPAPAAKAAPVTSTSIPAAAPAAQSTNEQRVAAPIVLPAELVTEPTTVDVPVIQPETAAVSPMPPAPTPVAAMKPAAAPALQPQLAATTAAPVTAPPPVMTKTEPVRADATVPVQENSADPTPTMVSTATETATPPASPPSPAVTSTPRTPRAQTVETLPKSARVNVEAVPVAAVSTLEAEDAPAVDIGEIASSEPSSLPAAAAGSASPVTSRPSLTSTRPGHQQPVHNQAAGPPAEAAADAQAETGEVQTEDEEVTNRRMLAPKHVGSEARADMQGELASPAQSAGQNQTNARPDATPPPVNGEREDNLLALAVTAAGKSHEGHTAGDGETGGNPDGAPTDGLDGVTATAHAGEPAKAQGTDFAQSLRQAAAPHRPGAYMPPTQQMAIHVQRAIAEGNERLSIRLNPQELGRIDVQLEIGSEGKLRAKVMVENPQTLEMLQKDARNLEKALQDAGLQTDQNSLSFSLQDSGDQAQQRQDQREQPGYGTELASEEVDQEDPAILAQTQIMELGRVDVRV